MATPDHHATEVSKDAINRLEIVIETLPLFICPGLDSIGQATRVTKYCSAEPHKTGSLLFFCVNWTYCYSLIKISSRKFEIHQTTSSFTQAIFCQDNFSIRI